MPESAGGAAARAALVIASAGGIGFLRPAPGTWATAATALAAGAWLLWQPGLARSGLVAALVVATVAGLLACGPAARRLGRGDPSQVVIDEVAGTLAGLAILPGRLLAEAPLASVAAVAILFRVFDIAKPPPVSSAEALPGALGIMTDDVVAGLLAGCLAAALLH